MTAKMVTYQKLYDFTSVKVDDVVIAEHGAGANAVHRTATVVRVTKTQIVCTNKWGQEERYMRKSGAMVGNGPRTKFSWVHDSSLLGIVKTEVQE